MRALQRNSPTQQRGCSTQLCTIHLHCKASKQPIPSEPLRIAVDHMSNGAVHSVLVVDDGGDLVGIVTSTDLIQQLGDLL